MDGVVVLRAGHALAVDDVGRHAGHSELSHAAVYLLRRTPTAI